VEGNSGTVIDCKNIKSCVDIAVIAGRIAQTRLGEDNLVFVVVKCHSLPHLYQTTRHHIHSHHSEDVNTLRMGSFKLFERPPPGFLTILTL